MGKRTFGKRVRHRALVMAAILSLVGAKAGMAQPANRSDGATTTPIKHVVIIIGENRTFDEIFATYRPVRQGTMVSNLLSKGIVNADGSPGPNYDLAKQYSATDTDEYHLAPAKTPYETLPPAMVGGPETAYGCQLIGITAGASCDTSENEQKVAAFETAIDPSYLKYLLTGGTGQPKAQPDSRITYAGHGPTSLPPGPFQLTSATMPYDAYAASPVHRLFQMWQQQDCSAKTKACANDLFPWVEATVGAGSNGAAQPKNFTDESTGEGSTSMSFFNVQAGDSPYLKSLADQYTMSDNYHQGINGGTGANHVMLGTGDAVWFSDGKAIPRRLPTMASIRSTPARRRSVIRARCPKSKIQTHSLARITSTSRMVTAAPEPTTAARRMRRPKPITAAAATSTAPIPLSQASPRSGNFSMRARFPRTAKRAITIWSTITTRAISATVPTPTPTRIPTTPSSPFRRRRSETSATNCPARTSPGPISATSSI